MWNLLLLANYSVSMLQPLPLPLLSHFNNQAVPEEEKVEMVPSSSSSQVLQGEKSKFCSSCERFVVLVQAAEAEGDRTRGKGSLTIYS